MSILIKGAKMPKNCCECAGAYCDNNRWLCTLAGESVDCFIYVECGRPTFCPLVEIPPHGRLIDADTLEYNGLRCYTPEVYEPPRDDTELVISKYEIDEETPTVIESEEE